MEEKLKECVGIRYFDDCETCKRFNPELENTKPLPNWVGWVGEYQHCDYYIRKCTCGCK